MSLQNPGSYDECIPIGDFSFDPHKTICCSLESGNIISHGSGGKGYGLATTAITAGCFIWKVTNWSIHKEKEKKTRILFARLYLLLSRLYHRNVVNQPINASLLSSILPKRTEAMRPHVLAFHAGQSKITTTTPPLICGYIGPIVATCTMEENWSAPFPLSLKVTPSPASWTWRLTPYRLPRMTRSDQLFSIQVFFFRWLLRDVFKIISSFWGFPARNQSWHLKVWLPLNFILVCCSTAVILERRYTIYFACSIHVFPPSINPVNGSFMLQNTSIQWNIVASECEDTIGTCFA